MAPELGQHLVFETVEWSEVNVAALGLDHLIMIAFSEQRGDAEPGSRPDDRSHTFFRQRPIGPAYMAKIVLRQARHGVGDRAEIVDYHVAVYPEPLLDQCGANYPRIVGQLQHLATDGAGESDG